MLFHSLYNTILANNTISGIAIIVLSIICEAETATLVAIWFMPAAIVSLVLSFFAVPLWIQVVVFFACAALLLFLFKVCFNVKSPKENNKKTNLDRIIGERCIVIEEISNLHGTGAVKVNGQVWSARSLDDNAVIPEGKTVTIENIVGVKIICKISE